MELCNPFCYNIRVGHFDKSGFNWENMKEFIGRIEIYDLLLIETGGRIGKNKFNGDKYIEECIVLAKDYINKGGNINDIIEFIENTILEYSEEKQWIFLDQLKLSDIGICPLFWWR